MNTLIAIYSCQADVTNGRNEAIRQTWVKQCTNTDVKFFIGGTNPNPLPDEVWLDVYDKGDKLIYKEVKMLEWGVNQGYERIFKTETDAYLDWPLIETTKHRQYDVYGGLVGYKFGEFYGNTNVYSFVQGHAVSYSRVVADAIVKNLIFRAENGTKGVTGNDIDPSLRAADLWSGQIYSEMFLRGEITVYDDRRFGTGPLSWHCPGDEKDTAPEFMKAKHKGLGR